MSIAKIDGVEFSGLSVCVPKKIASNEDYPFPSERERKQFIKTTGIEGRRVCDECQTAADFCEAAGKKLLTELEVDKSEIGVLIFISQTPDYLIPPTSTILQHELGLPKSCVALDINLGCSGYVYGLFVAASMMKSLGAKKALLLVGDVSTKCISPEDKSTTPIFSDAGSATLLSADMKATPMYFNLANDGKSYEAISIPDGGARTPFSEKSLVVEKFEEGIKRNKLHLIMKGVDVFNFSLREVAPNVKELLKELELSVEEVDYYVFHQANKLMNEAIRRKINAKSEQVPYSLKDFGNTGAATIPVTMVTQLRAQLQEDNLKLLLCGFGVGLSWGSVILDTRKIKCLPLLEL